MAKPPNGFEVASSSDIFDACKKGIQLGGDCGEKKSVKWSVLSAPSPFSKPLEDKLQYNKDVRL